MENKERKENDRKKSVILLILATVIMGLAIYGASLYLLRPVDTDGTTSTTSTTSTTTSTTTSPPVSTTTTSTTTTSKTTTSTTTTDNSAGTITGKVTIPKELQSRIEVKKHGNNYLDYVSIQVKNIGPDTITYKDNIYLQLLSKDKSGAVIGGSEKYNLGLHVTGGYVGVPLRPKEIKEWTVALFNSDELGEYEIVFGFCKADKYSLGCE